MNEEDASEYLRVIRRVISRNGLSAVDTDVFNSLFVTDESGEPLRINPVDLLSTYMARIETYFRYFSNDRFQENLQSLSELCDERVEGLNLILDQRLKSQSGRLNERQSLGELVRMFDVAPVLNAVQNIQKHIRDINSDEPPPPTQQTPGGM